MANSKDNLSKYGKAFISFDEASGNAMDSIGGYTGALNNAPTRVEGWNGKGYAMNFNGSNQYIQYNNTIVPIGAKSVRYKIKTSVSVTTFVACIANSAGGITNGIQFGLENEKILIVLSSSTGNIITIRSNKTITDGKWHDILFTWDGTTNPKTVKLFVDNMMAPNSIETAKLLETNIGYKNLTIGCRTQPNDSKVTYFHGQLDQIEIYDRIISPIPDKHLIQHNSQYKYHDGTSWQTTTNTEENFIKYGMNNLDHITEAHWKELSGNKSIVMWSDFEDKQFTSVVLKKEDFTAQDLLGDTPQVIYYTDSDASQIVVEAGVEPFSVYDYIGELPTVVAYTETTDDIIVSTTTEPFDIYDEFGESVEVLYYTDDEAVTSADLILEANWSPIDELEGDFEVVTWTDEAPDTANRVLEMKAVPKPQFIKLVNPKRLYGYLDNMFVNDISQSYRDEARYFITDENNSSWYVWDASTQSFIISDISSEEAILKNGMKFTDMNEITDKQWRTWAKPYINIGVFLKDNPRDTIISIVDNVSYEDYLPRHTNTLEKASFYLLNTTAKIDISLVGNTLKGVLSDEDLTRVQYRVLLNGAYYYPADGSFTKLAASPQNISLSIASKHIKIDDWNTLKIEFQDSFGTTDDWQTTFIGTYSGLVFKDVYGKYYSNEIGEVLKYLDFGIIVAGQTTVEHEVILKNQYGYDVKNIHLFANTSNFPTGMKIEFSESLAPFTPYPELKLNRTLQNNEEMSFFIRLQTELGVTPDANGSFDIIVRADKA